MPDAHPASRAARYAFGRAQRGEVARSAHAAWTPAPDRQDPVALVLASSVGRVPSLLPIRYARMATSAFAFYRGTANIMAADLHGSRTTGLTVQLCGDAHCMNFGGFETPEGRTIFDVNDFDETLPGPWEWDLKRLAASAYLAAKVNGLRERDRLAAAAAAVRGYREMLQRYAAMTALEVWADRIDARNVVALTDAVQRRGRGKQPAAEQRVVQHRYFELTDVVDGTRKIIDQPPLIYHVPANAPDGFMELPLVFEQYRQSLRDDLRQLFSRYTLSDWVVKVVGVGSVGTRCAAALFLADDDDPLILQVKEASASVLEAFLGPSPFANHGQRVVVGQRLMQSASDFALGWTSDAGHDYYVRQLRAIHGAPDLSVLDGVQLVEYTRFCGRALANAHARVGDRAAIAGYVGTTPTLDNAIAVFAHAYAEQVEMDFQRFLAAREHGRFGPPPA